MKRRTLYWYLVLFSVGLIAQPRFPTIEPSRHSAQEIRSSVEQHGIEYQPFTLDEGTSVDVCVTHAHCLYSRKVIQSTQLHHPIIILAHGFSATSYEWKDFVQYLDEHRHLNINYSMLVLGGHGRSLQAFRKSTWHDWGRPILEEFNALVKFGFTNISIAASSTACALVLEQLSHGSYANQTALKNIFFIDPIVEPQSFIFRNGVYLLSFSDKSYGPSQPFTPEEFPHWYGYRPYVTINSLNELTGKVEKALQFGMTLPFGTNLYVWASQNDPTVNPQGYKLIQQGVNTRGGGQAHYYPMDSYLHVLTRLSGRPMATQEDLKHPENFKKFPVPIMPHDQENQRLIFEKMTSAMQEN